MSSLESRQTAKNELNPALARAYGIVFTAIRNKTGQSQTEFGDSFSHNMRGTSIGLWEKGNFANDYSFPAWNEKKETYATKGEISVTEIDSAAHAIRAAIAQAIEHYPNLDYMRDSAQRDLTSDITGILEKAGLPIGEKEAQQRVQQAVEAEKARGR